VRGLSNCRLLIYDEAAYVDDALFAATRPMMAVNKCAQTIMLSTPNGRRGQFFDVWHDSDPSWTKVQVRATECSRISPEFLAEELRPLGPIKFSQEFELQFVDNQTAAFNSQIIDAAFTHEVRPLW
jgi:hypothetical protein